MAHRKSLDPDDDLTERNHAFIREHVMPRLKRWRMIPRREGDAFSPAVLEREPTGAFSRSATINLDDPQRVEVGVEADALFTEGVHAGQKVWRARATKPDSRAKVVLRLMARAAEFLDHYATPLSAARWLTENPDLDPMEGEVTAMCWALAGRPREALRALARASAYGDSITEPHAREFFMPIIDEISELERDLRRRPAALQRSLQQQIKCQLAAYRRSGVM
jgi:hypothetical protein